MLEQRPDWWGPARPDEPDSLHILEDLMNEAETKLPPPPTLDVVRLEALLLNAAIQLGDADVLAQLGAGAPGDGRARIGSQWLAVEAQKAAAALMIQRVARGSSTRLKLRDGSGTLSAIDLMLAPGSQLQVDMTHAKATLHKPPAPQRATSVKTQLREARLSDSSSGGSAEEELGDMSDDEQHSSQLIVPGRVATASVQTDLREAHLSDSSSEGSVEEDGSGDGSDDEQQSSQLIMPRRGQAAGSRDGRGVGSGTGRIPKSFGARGSSVVATGGAPRAAPAPATAKPDAAKADKLALEVKVDNSGFAHVELRWPDGGSYLEHASVRNLTTHVRALFDKMDKDRSGTIDRKELGAQLKADGELEQLLGLADAQGFREVVALLRRLEEGRTLDADGDSKITYEEFERAAFAAATAHGARGPSTSSTVASSTVSAPRPPGGGALRAAAPPARSPPAPLPSRGLPNMELPNMGLPNLGSAAPNNVLAEQLSNRVPDLPSVWPWWGPACCADRRSCLKSPGLPFTPTKPRIVNAGFGGSPAVDETFGTPILSTIMRQYDALQHRLSFPQSGQRVSFPSGHSASFPKSSPAPSGSALGAQLSQRSAFRRQMSQIQSHEQLNVEIRSRFPRSKAAD
jgi:hypothetical protein